jgi:hypothetical protein
MDVYNGLGSFPLSHHSPVKSDFFFHRMQHSRVSSILVVIKLYWTNGDV